MIKRAPIILSLAIIAVLLSGCTESPRTIVKKYVEMSRNGNISGARQYCAGDASLKGTTLIRRG